jgi:threonine dehydrogenase-like Zn-dependent dehydrogenase
MINPLDAIIKTELTAICGSDLHLYYIPTMKAGSDQPPNLKHITESSVRGKVAAHAVNSSTWRR